MINENGFFLTLEGGEGTGKSTLAKGLADKMRSLGHDVVLTREPGGTPLAEGLRQFIKTIDMADRNPYVEMLLFNVARRDHLERVINPALAANKLVICDRYIHSTLVYQAATTNLCDSDVLKAHSELCGDVWPDFTFLLKVDLDIALARIAGAKSHDMSFDKADRSFHEEIATAYEFAMNYHAPIYQKESKEDKELGEEVWNMLSASVSPEEMVSAAADHLANHPPFVAYSERRGLRAG